MRGGKTRKGKKKEEARGGERSEEGECREEERGYRVREGEEGRRQCKHRESKPRTNTVLGQTYFPFFILIKDVNPCRQCKVML